MLPGAKGEQIVLSKHLGTEFRFTGLERGFSNVVPRQSCYRFFVLSTTTIRACTARCICRFGVWLGLNLFKHALGSGSQDLKWSQG